MVQKILLILEAPEVRRPQSYPYFQSFQTPQFHQAILVFLLHQCVLGFQCRPILLSVQEPPLIQALPSCLQGRLGRWSQMNRSCRCCLVVPWPQAVLKPLCFR